MLEPIERHLRSEEPLDAGADLVVRGWPLTVQGLLANATQAMERFSWDGHPLIAVSAEATIAGSRLDAVLSGPRLRTRKRYAATRVGSLAAAGFELLPTFGVPHYSVVLRAYTEAEATRLLVVLGPVHQNPHFIGRMR